MASDEPRRFIRAQYNKPIEIAFFPPSAPIELIGGALAVAERHGVEHKTGHRWTARALSGAFGPARDLRSTGPIDLDTGTGPERVVAVVCGSVEDYGHADPSRPVLTVEVAVSSLGVDRQRKGSLYARAGLTDYWVLNLVDRTLEVYREPVADSAAPFGWRYGGAEVLGVDAHVTPLAAPAASIPIARLLP